MKHYFLFGAGICRALNDGGMRAACKYAQNEFDWAVFCFDTDEMEPHELLEAADGWSDWACLTEKEYKKLNNI
jgi:hypothetical protein